MAREAIARKTVLRAPHPCAYRPAIRGVIDMLASVQNLSSFKALQAPTVRPKAAPFLKWAGGKSRILSKVTAQLPPEITGRYFEPFLGGGAVFFGLQPTGGVQLSDINGELVNVYRCVRDEVDALIGDLGRHRYEKNYYYAVRAQDPQSLTDLERASRLIFLNRTCFNGLYRVNRRGQFNVPFGRYTNPTICQEDRLRAASAALADCAIGQLDYATAVSSADSGDVVYFDPPYDPISPTANFTSYASGGFGRPEQERLSKLFAKLSDKGVHCTLSNSDTPFIRSLYSDFRITQIEAPRAISRSAAGRKPVLEVLVSSR